MLVQEYGVWEKVLFGHEPIHHCGCQFGGNAQAERHASRDGAASTGYGSNGKDVLPENSRAPGDRRLIEDERIDSISHARLVCDCTSEPGRRKAPLLPKDLQPYPVVANIDFAEGPIFDSQGNLYFANYVRNGANGRLAPDGTVSVWCETGGQVNGLKVDSSGFIIGADAGAKHILQFHPSGKPIEVLTDQFEGKPYSSPNNLS